MKKSLMKKFALLMSVLMILTSMAVCASAEEATINPADWSYWDGLSVDVTPFEGKDPKVDYNPEAGHTPIVIETAAQLAGLSKVVNESGQGGGAKGAYRNWPIYITKNIDLYSYKFTPIGWGYNTAAFGGFLEGRLNGEEGKAVTIKNLWISEGAKVYTPSGLNGSKPGECEAVNNAFIPTLRKGGVMNLTFENAKVGHPNALGDCGIVVGYFSKEGSVFSGVTVKNSTLITGYATGNSGGVIGQFKNENIELLKNVRAENLTMVTRISEDGEYAAERNVGGIVGTWDAKKPLTFENCYFSGKVVALDTMATIEADMYAGGFIGNTMAGQTLTFKNCEYAGDLAYAGEDREASVSAFVGYHAGGASAVTLEGCRANGTPDALIGSDASVIVNLTDCTAANDILVVKGGSAHTVTGALTVDAPVEDPTEPPVEEPTEPAEDPTEPVVDPTEPPVDEPVEEVGFFQAIINAIIAFFKNLFGL